MNSKSIFLTVLVVVCSCHKKTNHTEEESKDAFCEIRRQALLDEKSSVRVALFYQVGSRGICRELEKRFEEEISHVNLRFQCICKPEAY